MKVYYLNLKFVNSGTKAALVSWVDPEGKPRSLEINQGSMEDRTVFTTAEVPPSVVITAVDKETNKQLMVNNVEKLPVAPREVADVVTVNIGQGT